MPGNLVARCHEAFPGGMEIANGIPCPEDVDRSNRHGGAHSCGVTLEKSLQLDQMRLLILRLGLLQQNLTRQIFGS